MPTLRDQLRDTPPQDFAVKEAWRALLRALRARRKAGGPAPILAGAAEIERALSFEGAIADPVQAGAIKRGLRALLRDGLDGEALFAEAAAVEAAVLALAPPPAEGLVSLWVGGLPPLMGMADRERLLGCPFVEPLRLPAAAAAALVARLDGLELGGETLSVRVEAGLRLPAVPREARWSLERGEAPHLPHLDAEGTLSLTPRSIAARQAGRLRAPAVIEGYAGCGGNTVAFAQAGLQVFAVERDAGRISRCRANLGALGLLGKVQLHPGDIRTLLPGLLARAPEAAVFFDPPWGGADRPLRRFAELELPAVPDDRELHLKLPREFELSSLPPGEWRAAFEISGGVVKMITAMRVGIAKP